MKRIVHRGKSSGRADDTEETARHRIATFRKQSVDAMKYFSNIGMKMYKVDMTKPIEENVKKILALPLFQQTKANLKCKEKEESDLESEMKNIQEL